MLERFDLLSQKNILASKLSGGEKQRLSLALAISTNSKILLLDEPTANADPYTTFKIEQIIKEEASTTLGLVGLNDINDVTSNIVIDSTINKVNY